MPTYDYRCKKCGHTFERVMGLKEHERHKSPQCPKCGSRRVEQAPSYCQVVTSKKA